MKKIYLLLVILIGWQSNSQVLNQNANWPNAAWTITGTYNADPLAFEANPTTTANFAFDDDDAGNPSDDNIAAESPIIDLTTAFTAGEQKVRVSALYGYYFLPADQLRFDYWDADASTWVAWSGNLPGNSTTVLDNFCSIPKTNFSTPDLDISGFTATQLTGFRYRISYDDDPAGADWNYGFCFNSPTIISVPTPCLTGFLFPDVLITPTVCDGFTPNLISDASYAGDYFEVAVTDGQTYQFTSSVATDFYTISTDAGLTSVASNQQPLSWVSNVTGTIRVYLNTDITCGTEDVDRETNVICGTLCLNGGLYPAATLDITTCDGATVNSLTTDSWAGEYSNVNVFASNTYTFSSSVATDYITIANAAGTSALAVGTGSVEFSPAADGVVRVYFHTDNNCGTQNTDRAKNVVCTTSVVLPDCAINLMPMNGSTTVPAFGDIIFTWDAPTSGGPVVSYNVFGGVDPANLVLFGNVTETTFNAGAVDQYDFVGYWQIVPVNAGGSAVGCTVFTFTTESQPTDTPDYVNLQFPGSITVTEGNTEVVYGQVYEAGLTDVAPNIEGQAPGILAWLGVSPIGDNSNPDTWVTWLPMTWNAGNISNNDEYQLDIPATLPPGTYYYATRYTLNNGPFVYGGYSATGGGFWDGTGNVSGVLTVNPAPAPANDECAAATALTVGGVFATNQLATTNLGSTLSSQAVPTCGEFNFATVGKDVWYTVTVPASGNVTIQTQGNGGLADTAIEVYSGVCTALVLVDCNDDDPDSLYSILNLTNRTANEVLYVRAWGFNGSAGNFLISAFDASLSTSGFDMTNFSAYPNPVKDVLNLSYIQDISSVEVFNLLGQKVISKSLNSNQGQIDMSALPRATYLVKVSSEAGTATIKVVKE